MTPEPAPSPPPSPSRPPRRLDWDLTPLARPPWWAALALLLVNDNLLKASAWAPRWLTGKLSDFAFLVVAPVLLYALTPCRLRARRPLALVAVAAVYAAADLSPDFSRWFVAGARDLGFTWQLWPDVTDLLALAVLPLAWWLMSPPSFVMAPLQGSPNRRRLQPVAVIAGAWACLATSAPPEYPQRAFLVNRTDHAVSLTVAWSQGGQTCDGDLAALVATLPASSFLPPVSLTLAAGEVAALDQPPAADVSPVGRCSNAAPGTPTPYPGGTTEAVCTVVVVRQPGQPATAVRAARVWFTSNSAFIDCAGERTLDSRCASRLDPVLDPGEGAVALVDGGGGVRLMAHQGIELAVFPGP
jgi:hypothetical protein